jgi:hypothetical protein
VAQHFLPSAKARTLSLSAILRIPDDEAHKRFALRGKSRLADLWIDNQPCNQFSKDQGGMGVRRLPPHFATLKGGNQV